MKVQGPPGAKQIEVIRPSPRSRAADRTSATAPGAAQVRVSDEARQLADVRAQETPDAARIERLRSEIAKGTFTVDADKVARAMIDEERG